MLRTQIGDYNRALDDYDKVALDSPNNVLVYYNRAGVYAQLGETRAAPMDDYTSAIKLYPDFANAYIYRGRLRELLRDPQGAKRGPLDTAQRKIAEYRSRLSDSTYSIYADTTQRFDRLLSFDSKFAGRQLRPHHGPQRRPVSRRCACCRCSSSRSCAPTPVPDRRTLSPAARRRLQEARRTTNTFTLSCRESNIPRPTRS